jgi:anthranilate phosphoribosyltransferase
VDLTRAIERIRDGGELQREDARALVGGMLDAPFDGAELAAFLIALAERGERFCELAGAADALRERMVAFAHDHDDAIDTCGTGGDGLCTFNLSTATAIVVCAAGVKVIKHGNRNQSSACGSADLLEAAGLPLDLSPESARRVLDDVGITFLYAPRYHPLLARVAVVRRALARRTLFNWLGPLCNPGSVSRQMVGAPSSTGVELVAAALGELDVDRAYAVHGAGGADELTLAGENRVLAVNAAPEFRFDAQSLGLQSAPVAALRGGDATENLRLLRGVLDCEPSPIYDAVRLNSACALVLAGHASPRAALDVASEALRSGAARATFTRWVSSAREARVA